MTSITFNADDLRTIVAFILNYNDMILSKPVYVMQIKNKMRKLESVRELDENNFDGVEPEFLMDLQLDRGLVNLAFFSKFTAEFAAALANILGGIVGANVGNDVKQLIDAFKETAATMCSL